MAESYPDGKKTLWEKEKLLVTSNFFFSQCFQKACFPGASKDVIVWEWVNKLSENPFNFDKSKFFSLGLEHFTSQQCYKTTNINPPLREKKKRRLSNTGI